MNFGLSEEQEMIVKTVRDFVETEIEPHAQEWEQAGIFPAHASPCERYRPAAGPSRRRWSATASDRTTA